jgi:puromycin-sensitive aminopeptidase
MTTTSYRLPRHVLPIDYDVTLEASPRRTSFSGEVTIDCRLLSPSRCLELHAVGLTIGRVRANTGSRSFAGRAAPRRDRETIELVFAKELPKGRLRLTLAFKGKLNPGMHGLYLAEDGADQAIVSQCEATDARRIFPCFDEPDLKASLRWTVLTDAGLDVVTNGAQGERRKKRGTKLEVHYFKRTRVMPTYLAAVTIGHLASTKVRRLGGVPCRIWCSPGKLDQTALALEVTAQVLPWLQDYFGQKYNYQKLDQVAVPGFDAGAMENVGAIFYRQNLLLLRPDTASWMAQKRSAEVITHEISHQWFGNLVTMRWWDDLWLNEAFATWIAFKAVDAWRPDWRIWDDYLGSKEAALEADALVSTHPVYSEVKSPAEATELFDVITYEKGGAVLRMVESYLSPELFREGIRRYQAAFKNKNACGADLWRQLEEVSGEAVGELMQSWITQPGFPLVTCTASEVSGRRHVHLSQQRFFANPSEMQQEHAQKWAIPILVRYETGNGSSVQRLLLREHEQVFVLPPEATGAWIYPNDEAAGFFRLRLDDELLEALLQRGLGALSPAARMGLLEDQWALVRAGVSDIERFLDVLEAFRGERDYAVVRTIAARLSYIDQRLVRDEQHELYRSFVRHLLGDQLEELGWEPEPEEPAARSVRRATVIAALGDLGRDAGVLDEAERRVAMEMHEPTAIDANLAGVAVSLGALRGDLKRLARYIGVYRERKSQRQAPELPARYLGALASFESPKVVARVLSLCLDGTVPQEQVRTVLGQLLSRRATQQETWRFLKRHWNDIGPRVGLMGISRLVEGTGALPVELAAEVAAFFEKHPVAEAKRALAQALEALALRRELLEREAGRLADWLNRFASPTE